VSNRAKIPVSDSSKSDLVRYLLEANPTGEISDSPHSGRVLTPANTAKDREHLYIAGRVLAICFLTRRFLTVSTISQQKAGEPEQPTDVLKNWVMVFLTLGFVALYGLALIGKLKPLADVSIVARIEPIIFVIIGYYFGRLPAQQNENSLKHELGRQTQRADAAQHAKEQALQNREALEERTKNLRATLANPYRASTTESSAVNSEQAHCRHALDTAIKILDS
jgi:hypothetical protein